MTRKQSINRSNYPRTVAGPGVFAVDLDEDIIIADSTAGAVTLNLPRANADPTLGLAPNIIYIKMPQAGGNNVTINATGGETIDGFASVVAIQNNAWLVIKSDTANWQVVAAFGFADFGPFFKYSFGPDNSNAVFNSGATRIQDAINAAASDPDQPQIVVGLPGAYTENVTITDGVALRGFSEINLTRIQGTLSIAPSGTGLPIGVEEISFFQEEDAPAADFDFSSSGFVTVRRCNFVSQGTSPTSSAVRIHGANFGQVDFDDCQVRQESFLGPNLQAFSQEAANVQVRCFNRTLIENISPDNFSAVAVSGSIGFQDCRFVGQVATIDAAIDAFDCRFETESAPCFAVLSDSPASRLFDCKFQNQTDPIISWPSGSGPFVVDCSSLRPGANMPEFATAGGVNLETFRLNTGLAEACTQARLLSAAGEAEPRGNSSDVHSCGLFPTKLSLEDDQLGQCFELVLKLESQEPPPDVQQFERNGSTRCFEIKEGKQYFAQVQCSGTRIPWLGPTTPGSISWLQNFTIIRPIGAAPSIVAPTNTTITQDTTVGAVNPIIDPLIFADLGTFWATLQVVIEGGTFRFVACVNIVEVPGVSPGA